jgi:3-methyl-2-oxobutanoate hydroxymethyltransferase
MNDGREMSVAALQQMKREGKKIAIAITYDYQMAQIMDRAGVELLTVGDSKPQGRRSDFWVHL